LACERRHSFATVRRAESGKQQLEEALAEAQRELKRCRQNAPAAHSGNSAAARKSSSVLDEEERLYQELQCRATPDLITQKLQKKQEETRTKVHAALQGLLSEDKRRTDKWASDLTAVLLAVDGLEGRLRQGVKAKKGKPQHHGPGAASSPTPPAVPVSADQVADLQEQLRADFDDLRKQLEDMRRDHLSFEQAVGALHDGADATVAAMELDAGIVAAEKEVECIRQTNASWVERVKAFSLETTSTLLGRTEEALRSLLECAPPGLLPPNVEDGLRETREQTSGLRTQLDTQARSLAELQEDSVCFGRRLNQLQVAHRTLRAGLQQQTSQELQRSAVALRQPLERLKQQLQHHDETLNGATTTACDGLDALVSQLQRSAAAEATSTSGSGTGGSDVRAIADALLGEVVQGELREVRTIGKALKSSFEDGSRALSSQMDKVFVALVGESPGAPAQLSTNNANNANNGSKVASAVADIEGRGTGVLTDTKKKVQRRKGRPNSNVTGTDTPAVAAGDDQAASSGVDVGSEPQPAPNPDDEEAKLRDEFHEAFKDTPKGRSKNKNAESKKGDGDKKDQKHVLTGTELLHELQSLRSDAQALEARMAARLGSQGEDKPAGVTDAAPKPKAARRKKLYV